MAVKMICYQIGWGWLLGKGDGLVPNEPGFSPRWYPYESLVIAGRTSYQSCSCSKVLQAREQDSKDKFGFKSGRVNTMVIVFQRTI